MPDDLQKVTEIATETPDPDMRAALNSIINRSTKFVAVPEIAEFRAADERVWPLVPDSVLRVVVVSFKLPETDLSILKADYYGYLKLWELRPEVADRLRHKLNEAVDLACNHGAHVIVCSELCFPLGQVSTQIKPEKWSEERNRRIKDFTRAVAAAPYRQGPVRYLIAGSFHDPIQHFNVAPLITFGQNEVRAKIHAKRTSAVRASEEIRLLPTRSIRIYDTQYCNLSILICLDLFDASQVLSLAEYNHTADQSSTAEPGLRRVDLVAIPSLGMHESAVTQVAVLEASLLLGSIVAFAHSSADECAQWLYVGGKQVPPTTIPWPATCSYLEQGEISLFEVSGQFYEQMRKKSAAERVKLESILPSSSSPKAEITVVG
jgi:hypothetical protein